MGWRPLPGREPDRFVQVSDVVDQVLGRLGAPSGAALRIVFDRWGEIVGDQVASHAEPVTVADGRLVIRADDPAWASQLRWLSEEILGRVRALVGQGVVVEVEVRVGLAGRRSARRPNRPSPT